MADSAVLDRPVKRVMAPGPVTLFSLDAIGEAISMMASGRYRRSPIVEADGRPIGVLEGSGILRYLVEQGGVAEERLVIEAHGENAPLIREDSEFARSMNRRVEFSPVR